MGTRPWLMWLRLLVVLLLVVALITAIRGPDSGAIEHVAGVLDTTFDGDGIAVTEIASDIEVRDSAVQVLPGGSQRLLVLEADGVWRFLPDGTLDTSFHDDGVLPLTLGFDLEALAASPDDGAFVVGGGSGNTVFLRRFRADGSVDTGFGGFGSASASTVTEGVGGCPVVHSFTGFGDLAMVAGGSTVVAGPGDIGACDVTATDEGVLAVQFAPGGNQQAVHGADLCTDENFGTELADPRSIQPLADGGVAVRVAVPCTDGVDPVTIVRFEPGLTDHVEFEHSTLQPTQNRRLPLLVEADGGFAIAAESADQRAWNLLRWDNEAEFQGSTPIDLPGIATGTIGGLDLTDDGGYVVSGQVDGRAGPDLIGVGRFDREGVPVDLATVAHDDGATELDVRTTIRLSDGSVRLLGHAEPDVFGLDPDVQLAISRLGGTGVFDASYGGGDGGVQHLGGVLDAGEAVQVRPDLRVVAGGGITAPLGGREPTGFVLQHREAGPLDASFSPADRPGVEITRYAVPPAIVVPGPIGTFSAAASRADSVTSGVLAQADPPVDAATEEELRDAFGDPAVTHILLTDDITLEDCESSPAPDGIARDSGTDLTVDGAGHTITQTCEGHRILTVGDVAEGGPTSGTLTLTDLTLTGGNASEARGGAVNTTGALTVVASTVTGNAALFAGGVTADSDIAVTDSAFVENSGGGGGAIGALLGDGAVTVTGSTFEGNSSTSIGGAIATFDRDVSVTASTFVGNDAQTGGAIQSNGGGNITVTDSIFDGNRDEDGGGGAIGTQFGGDVSVVSSVFVGNTATGGGGAVSSSGVVDVTDSHFEENVSDGGQGGAIFAQVVDVDSSTFDSNRAPSEGAGGAIWAVDEARAVNSTFTNNEAGILAAAIYVEDGGLSLIHVTVADNEGDSQIVAVTLTSIASVIADSQGGDNCGDGTDVASSTYSWSDDASCAFTGTGDTINGTNAQLQPLADNGGPTGTMRPADSSPLVNAIPSDACTAIGIPVDQRGEARPGGPGCDIGAVEVFGPTMSIEVEGLALDASGRSVIAGLTEENRFEFSQDGAVHRLLPDGSPDPAFNDGRPVRGIDLFGFEPLGVGFHDVAVDTAGRIVVVGEVSEGDNFRVDDVLILRLRADGTPDPAFGSGGIVRIAPQDPSGTWTASARGVTIDDVGRILLTGHSRISFTDFRDHLLVARLTTTGTRDGSFGSSTALGAGTRVYPSPSEFEQVGNDIATRGTQVLVAGTRSDDSGSFSSEAPTVTEGFVRRLGTNGAPDTSFGPAGYRFPFAAAPGQFSEANALAVDAVGNVVVTGGSLGQGSAGSAFTLFPRDLLLARVQPDGTMDPVFATNGMAVTQAPGAVAGEQGRDVTIAPDGKIVVTGTVTDDRSTRVLTARYSPGLAELQCIAIPTNLGEVEVGTPLTTFIECTAVGGTVIVTGVTLDTTSTTPGDFTVDPETCAGARLTVGQTCFVSQTFTPTTTGARGAVVNIGTLTVRGPGAALIPVRGSGFVTGPTETPTGAGPFLFLTPEEGPIETEVEASGSVFDPGVSAQIRIGDVVVATIPGSAVGSNGGFTATFTVPPGTPGGPQDVVACQRCGTASEQDATAVFTVTPRLFVSPTLSRPGGVATATGDGFQPAVPVRLGWNPGLGGTTVLPDANGEFTASMLVFHNDLLGLRELEAFVSGSTEVAATTPFLAVPGSSQPGDFRIRR